VSFEHDLLGTRYSGSVCREIKIWFVGNKIYNQTRNLEIDTPASGNYFVANNIYGGGEGVVTFSANNNTFTDGTFGYDAAGTASADSTFEIRPGPFGNQAALTLKHVRINPTNGIETAAFDTAGTYLLSYKPGFSTPAPSVCGATILCRAPR